MFAEAVPRAVGSPRRAKSGHADPGGQRAWWFAKPGAKAEAGQVVATFTPGSAGPGIMRLRGADQRDAWGMARAGPDRGPARRPRCGGGGRGWRTGGLLGAARGARPLTAPGATP